MTQKLVAELSFSPHIRDRWPTGAFNAEAHLSDQSDPWSVRLELWSPPADSGLTFAWLSFLSDSAPFAGLPLDNSFEIRQGRLLIGRAVLRVFPAVKTHYEENDFEEAPGSPIRSFESAA